MILFSERYGYLKPSQIIIREQITIEIQNAICSCYDRLPNIFAECCRNKIFSENYCFYHIDVERYLWTHFLNKRENEFGNLQRYHIVSTWFIEDKNNAWYRKLDLIEFTIRYLRDFDRQNQTRVTTCFCGQLNEEFERLNFAYRVVNDEIVEITSEMEFRTIEIALQNSNKNIGVHLNKSLELYAQRPNGDYRNSIKEAISAVEAYCRERTGEATLGSALKRMDSKGIIFPKLLREAFEKLYIYTNQPDTGIRHALMDDEVTYTPKAEEALFMLVSCSAFINYLNNK